MSDVEVPRYYSNAVNVAATLHDITVTFSQAVMMAFPEGVDGPHRPTLEPQCQVMMSYPHVKALLPLLSRAIADYENQFGEVPAPGINRSA
jgi:hypothetical protein